jgi:U4/U6 small nuclear ribonucleoprotein PRP31
METSSAAAAAATTLADSLLEDLDDLSDVNIEENDQQEEEECQYNGSDTYLTKDKNDGRMMELDNEQQQQEEESGALYHHQEKKQPTRLLLLEDTKLQHHLELLRQLGRQQQKMSNLQNDNHNNNNNNNEMDNSYQLIVTSNKFLSQLTNEYQRAYSTLCRAYHPKFPELEELILDAKKFRQTVSIIGNQEMDMTKIINEELASILSSNQIITISVAGSTTSGRTLSTEEWAIVQSSCLYMDRVESVQRELSTFLEQKMESLAPNVCAIVGPTLAARLLGLAGGIGELANLPACNLQVLGQLKHSALSRAGLSTYHTRPHMGILAECDIIQRCPTHLQRRALKLVASKVVLAARCDYIHAETGRPHSTTTTTTTTTAGQPQPQQRQQAAVAQQFLREISTKITKWDEPDKAPVIKALPKPDMETKRRRGGKRIRKLKEQFEASDMLKQANKRAFSKNVGEYGDDAMGLTLGMLEMKEGGTGTNNTLRQPIEKRKIRQANTKASRKRAASNSSTPYPTPPGFAATSSIGGRNSSSGLASSMVFTPVQGLELINPDANKERVREANRKWFSETTGFLSALPRNT